MGAVRTSILSACLAVTLGGSGLAIRLHEGRARVQSQVENFRDEPGGAKLGTLLEGAELEVIEQDGDWVRFRIEGWVWGPALEGFERPEPQAAPSPASQPAAAPPLQEETARLRRYINEKHGVFYSATVDEDTQRLTLRFRVRDVGREALERKQMAVQREALAVLGERGTVATIRIETNRPDGSGRVGLEIAETTVCHVRQYAGGPPEEWRVHTRISTDGGQTWSR
ncbi:MAG: SH3 domain-containing protein [Candidatus Latescibacterota bacterium]